jgi:predicted  nucleic acid-binding Zn-ribbon protein
VLPALASLIALQALDTATDAARKRLADMPAARQALDATVATASEAVAAVKQQLTDNHQQRLALEKDVAAVQARMSRFEDHKAAVKTNQEYQALTHELATAKAEKDAIEDRLLVHMETDETLTAAFAAAQAALAATRRDTDKARAALEAEEGTLTGEIERLSLARAHERRHVEPAVLAKYEQLLKGRRGLAVASMRGESCTACHVRLRPHVTQQIRRNDSIVSCESCQRILYFEPPAAAGAAPGASPGV